MPFGLFSRTRAAEKKAALSLYNAIVAQARVPVFYERLGVPDTVDGRFDMVVIHAALVLRRLSAVPGQDSDRHSPAARLAQAVFDIMFEDMDRNLREMGVGDLSVGKHVKKMAKAYYGRAGAYEAGLRDGTLDEALRQNIYRDGAPDPMAVAGLAAYIRREAEALVAWPDADLLAGKLAFGPVQSDAAPANAAPTAEGEGA